MKKFSIIAVFCIFSVVVVNAQSTETEETTPATESTEMQDNKKEIQLSEAPETIQTGFQESEYAEWEITEVYEVTTDEGIMYEITVSDGITEETVMFDENGNIKENEE